MFQKLRSWIHEKIQDIKARLRGERRISPSGERGRVYARKPVARLQMRITRADGTVEIVDAPAQVHQR